MNVGHKEAVQGKLQVLGGKFQVSGRMVGISMRKGTQQEDQFCGKRGVMLRAF